MDLILDAYNHIGYDGINIGDFDLALGSRFLLKKRSRVKFPFISSNLVDVNSGRPLFRPYTVKEVDGLRVGIFGLLSPTFKSRFKEGESASPEDPFQIARRMVRKLRRRCDFIIALTLLQGQEEAERLAAEVPGINIIISGCGAALLQPVEVDSTIILQTRPRGESLGRLDLNIVRGSYDFWDASEREGISNQVKLVEARLQDLREKSKGEDLLEYYKDDTSALREIETLSNREKDLKEALKAFPETSYYTNRLIRLDKSYADDPEIAQMVKEYQARIAELRKSPPPPDQLQTSP